VKLGNIKKVVAGILVGGALCGNAFAAETLFSNNVFEVAPAGVDGSLWAVSRNGSYSGVTLLTFRVSDKGTVALESTVRKQVSDTLTAVHNGIILDDDEFAERRRIPSVYAGEKLGLVLPMFSMDSDDRYLQPAGFFSVVDAKTVNEFPMDVPSNVEDFKDPMKYALSGFAYDSTGKRLWMARGALGVMVHDISSNKGSKDTTFVLNVAKERLELLKDNTVLDSTVYPEIFDVRLHPETGDLWLATASGVWVKSSDGLKNISKKLEDSRVTGLWMGGNPLQIIAETNYKEKKNVVGGLWRIYGEKSEDFVKVDFLDTAGKVQKKDVYDEADYTVGDVAFLGNKAFVLVRTAGGSMSGYLKLDSLGVRAWEEDDDGKTQWLYGYETGATDRRAVIKSMCAFPLSKKRMGLAIATFGNGISVSADSGATWSVILNRAKLDNNLGSIRMVPSVITPGDEALVSYKVGRESKITIEVFSYDMRKVRTIVKDAVRNADAARSTNPKEDFWDGRDDHGKDCTMGVYYIRVKDNHGHIGWGKAITLGGNFR
jgi:hypothetical protein